MSETVLRTPLYEEIKKRGARLVPFAGYEMPVQFAGILAEHASVRTRAGLFDVSHMTEFWFEGPDALGCVDRLVTNDIAGLGDGQIAYSPMCLATGGIVDDLLVYRFSPEKLLIVANAANHDKDFAHLRAHLTGRTALTDRSRETAQLALQGPLAREILAEVASGELLDIAPFRFAEGAVAGRPCLVSRTGYTGEDGYEIYASNADIVPVFLAIERAGAPRGMQLIGLGARDTLRLEAKLCLYGNDIDETTSPLEAGLGWTVKFDGRDFIGREALLAQKQKGVERHLLGFEMVDKAIARHGYPVVPEGAGPDDTPLGTVASGAPSPTLDRNIGLVYLPKKGYKAGAGFGVVVRGKVKRAVVVKTPFYRRGA